MAALTTTALWSSQSLAQSSAPINDTDYLSKQAENPVTRKITVPLRYEADFLDGAGKLTKSTIELDQAVVPFRLNDDWSLITRTKLPVEALPPKNPVDLGLDGLSNGYTTFFLSPEHGQGFYWGAGPVLYYPATNEALGATNGVPVRPWHSYVKTKARGYSAQSSTIYGRSAAGLAAATEPTSSCSIPS